MQMEKLPYISSEDMEQLGHEAQAEQICHPTFVAHLFPLCGSQG